MPVEIGVNSAYFPLGHCGRHEWGKINTMSVKRDCVHDRLVPFGMCIFDTRNFKEEIYVFVACNCDITQNNRCAHKHYYSKTSSLIYRIKHTSLKMQYQPSDSCLIFNSWKQRVYGNFSAISVIGSITQTLATVLFSREGLSKLCSCVLKFSRTGSVKR